MKLRVYSGDIKFEQTMNTEKSIVKLNLITYNPITLEQEAELIDILRSDRVFIDITKENLVIDNMKHVSKSKEEDDNPIKMKGRRMV